ncbi:MAG: hypothetical protein E7H57_18860 [Pantoea sp.]|nr:hypothetical protein [Pantoea sp.]
MSESSSFCKRAGLALLAQSALVRTLYVSLALMALWSAIHWADAIA